MTHIAGLAVTMDARFIRQRCAWCGEIIQDDDLKTMASLDGAPPCSFECGALVRVDGGFSVVVDGTQGLPHDCCYTYEVTR